MRFGPAGGGDGRGGARNAPTAAHARVPQRGTKLSFPVVIICTTGLRILASASTNKQAEQSDLVWQEGAMAAVGPGMLRRPHMHGFLTGEGEEIPATMRASAALEEVHSYRDRMVRPYLSQCIN